jgi:hypothetical protein
VRAASLSRNQPVVPTMIPVSPITSSLASYAALRGIDPIRNARGAESDHRTANPQENFVSDMLRCSPSKDH